MRRVSEIVTYFITTVISINSSESSPAMLPVTFINRTRYTIAVEQPGQSKNSLVLSPYHEMPDAQIGEEDSVQDVTLLFKNSHKAFDGTLYKAIIYMQAMHIHPPFFHKGHLDKWMVYYKLVGDNHPEKLSYTIYEHNNNNHCDVFVLSNMVGVHAYRDVTFTKISSKL